MFFKLITNESERNKKVPQQFHVLVTGFELNRASRGDDRSTELRHYRYDTSIFDLDESKTGNSYIVKKGNSLVGRFPVSRTMVLVEDVAERSAN